MAIRIPMKIAKKVLGGSSRRKLWVMLISLAVALSAFVLTSLGRGAKSEKLPNSTIQQRTNPPVKPRSDQKRFVQRPRLQPQLRQALEKLGNRLENPGRERLLLRGELRRADDHAPAPLVLLRELPDRVRIEGHTGSALGRATVLGFDGQESWKGEGNVESSELDLIETLVYDTAEHFFISQSQGQATRYLGTRFRLDDDSAADASAPVYDLYMVTEPVKVGGEAQLRNKFYYVNSDTLLVERVRYQIERGGAQVNVEVQLDNWQNVDGQLVAGRIVRRENGQQVFALEVGAASLGPRVADSIFSRGRTR
jgi:hypothetical protein